jgi:hypothetical protein
VKPGAQLGVPIHIVDYEAIAADPDFTTFLTQLDAADTTGLTRNQTMALAINMYNAFAISTMVKFPCRYQDQDNNKGICYGPNIGLMQILFGPDSTLCDNNPFGGNPNAPDTKACKGSGAKVHSFMGKKYSCDEIEHMTHPVPLAPLFSGVIDKTEDLRLHAALVCDGTSCPNQKIGAYTPEHIDQQLDEAATAWMANPWKGMRVNKTSNTVYFTQIFKWFSGEFDKQGGVVKAYKKFFPAEAQEYFDSGAKYSVQYLNYVSSPRALGSECSI